MKKIGKETPAVVTIRQTWSIHDPGRIAAVMPSGSAIAIDKKSAHSVSSADAGSRVINSLSTGCPVLSEVPRSPCASSRR